MEELCSLTDFDFSSLLSLFVNVLVCIVVVSSPVFLLSFVHLNRRWREGRMSGDICGRLQDNVPPGTSTSKVAC